MKQFYAFYYRHPVYVIVPLYLAVYFSLRLYSFLTQDYVPVSAAIIIALFLSMALWKPEKPADKPTSELQDVPETNRLDIK